MGWISGPVILNEMTGLTGDGSGFMGKYGRFPGILGVAGFAKILGIARFIMIWIAGIFKITLVTSEAI